MLQGRLLATLGGLAAVLLWSLTVAFTRSLTEKLGPLTAAATVYGIGGLLAIANLAVREERRKRVYQLPRAYLVGCGLLFVVCMISLNLGIGLSGNREQVLQVGLLNYLWPVLTLLLTVVLLGKSASMILLPGTLLALGGVFLVLTDGAQISWGAICINLSDNPLVYVLGLVAAASWALYSVLTRKWVVGRNVGGPMIFLPVAALVLLVLRCFVDEPCHWSSRACMEALILGVAAFAAYVMWDKAMREGNVVIVVVGSYMTPFLSTIVSCLYLSVRPGLTLWVGCGMLVAGSLLSWYSLREE